MKRQQATYNTHDEVELFRILLQVACWRFILLPNSYRKYACVTYWRIMRCVLK